MSNIKLNEEQTKKLLQIVTKAGFKFYGRDENNDILVIAPNGQIVSILVAYKFLQDQKKQTENSGGFRGFESGFMSTPSNLEFSQIDQNLQSESLDSTVINNSDRNLERDKVLDTFSEREKNKELSDKKQEYTGITTTNKVINKSKGNSAVFVAKEEKKDSVPRLPAKPYYIGFDPKFDPTNLREIKKFVDKYLSNKKVNNKDSNIWLAAAFEKWLNEFINK